MKLTLQVFVEAPNGSTKFRDILFKFTLYTIIIIKVGGTRCHLGRHALYPTQFFSTKFERKTNMLGSYNMIASDIETTEASPGRETNPVDFDKLEGYKPKRPRNTAPR